MGISWMRYSNIAKPGACAGTEMLLKVVCKAIDCSRYQFRTVPCSALRCGTNAIMKKQTRKSKAGRPRTTGPGVQLQVRVHPPQLTLIDKWIARQKETITRAEAIRRLVDLALGLRR
jgi:hypothetical protein